MGLADRAFTTLVVMCCHLLACAMTNAPCWIMLSAFWMATMIPRIMWRTHHAYFSVVTVIFHIVNDVINLLKFVRLSSPFYLTFGFPRSVNQKGFTLCGGRIRAQMHSSEWFRWIGTMDPVETVTKKESHIVSGYVSSIKVGQKPPCNVILILTKESLLKLHSGGNYQGHWMV